MTAQNLVATLDPHQGDAESEAAPPPPPARPDVSVVMSTYNRADLVGEAIESVLGQAEGSPEFELIVVDNNSTDRTREVVGEMVPRSGGRLRYVFEERQGLSHGRNAGIAHARAPIVAFTDDDVRVAHDWVAAIKRAFDEHPDVDFVGGKVLPRWPTAPPDWLADARCAPLALTDHGDEPFVVDRSRPLCLVGASLAVRRDVFDRVGLFDPAFQHPEGSVSSIEDNDFELRVWRAGGKGLYVPSMVATADVQPNRLTKSYFRKWHSDYGALSAGLLRPGEMYDHDGALVAVPPDAVTVFGSPPWLYRAALREALAVAGAIVRRRESDALAREGMLRQQAAGLAVNFARFRARPGRSYLREVGSAVRALFGGGRPRRTAEGSVARPS